MAVVVELKKLFNTFLQENKCPTEEIVKKKYYFPVNQLKNIYTIMLTSTDTQWSQFQQMLTKHVDNVDFCYYSWECFASLVQQLNSDETNVYMFVNMLGLVSIPTEKKENNKLLFYNKSRPQFKYNLQQIKLWTTTVWDNIKPFMISNVKIRREMLMLLIEKMLVHLNNPLTTADFLMDSINTPGPIAILGLQGIFVLVKDYNLLELNSFLPAMQLSSGNFLECPNIYGKLYNLFTTNMFNYRYKTRLFYLADIFLRSSHLPELLVAAFVKRMARLSLIAPPTDIKIMTAFIGNLLIRHPSLKVLIQNDSTVNSDPYIFEENDPLKSNALNSSLWELISLKQHILPQVGKSVNFLFKKLPQIEWDISELLDDTYETIIDEEYKTDFQKVSLTFEKPTSFAVPLSSHMDDLWTL